VFVHGISGWLDRQKRTKYMNAYQNYIFVVVQNVFVLVFQKPLKIHGNCSKLLKIALILKFPFKTFRHSKSLVIDAPGVT